MKIKYVTIDLTTVDGYSKADRLKNRGWRIIRNGIFSVIMASK